MLTLARAPLACADAWKRCCGQLTCSLSSGCASGCCARMAGCRQPGGRPCSCWPAWADRPAGGGRDRYPVARRLCRVDRPGRLFLLQERAQAAARARLGGVAGRRARILGGAALNFAYFEPLFAMCAMDIVLETRIVKAALPGAAANLANTLNAARSQTADSSRSLA